MTNIANRKTVGPHELEAWKLYRLVGYQVKQLKNSRGRTDHFLDPNDFCADGLGWIIQNDFSQILFLSAGTEFLVVEPPFKVELNGCFNWLVHVFGASDELLGFAFCNDTYKFIELTKND